MGYGTALTPILLIMGIHPLTAVPAVLIGQLFGGLIAGITHLKIGNINLDFHPVKRLKGWGYLPRSPDARAFLFIGSLGVFGAITGVFTAVNIPPLILKTYIGAMVLLFGLVILLGKTLSISWKGLLGMGLLAGFNKGIGGGGYGPLVTAGQLIGAREPKSSVGVTTCTESLICLVGFLCYLFQRDLNIPLIIATVTGAVLAAPFAAMTTKKLKVGRLKLIIGVVTVLLGAATLLRTYVK